jgi:hypothetical protein
MHTITLELSDALYQLVVQTAKRNGQSLNGLVQSSLAQTLPQFDNLPPELSNDLAALPLLNDLALWRMAGKVLAPAQQNQLTELLDKQMMTALTNSEQQSLEQLRDEYAQVMVIRAEAAVLLKQRGYDISDPTVFNEPLPIV